MFTRIRVIDGYINFGIRLLIVSGILISCIYFIVGLITYFFFHNQDHKQIGRSRMKKAMIGLLIIIGTIFLMIVVEQLFPQISFGISTDAYPIYF